MFILFSILAIIAPLGVLLGGLYIWAEYYSAKIGVTPVEEPMLRSPGETQRQRIEELTDKLIERMMFAIIPPIVLAISFVQLALHTQHGWLGVSLLVLCSFGFTTVPAMGVVKIAKELRNRRLGYAGECVTAERLQPLLQSNCFVFHDCPADEHGNIDHVVVTPSKVYAIETKTRGKRLSPDTHRYEAQVTFDGKRLVYPWGSETFGLDQARRQAAWLSKLLSDALCENVPVEPVLALPGWFVELKARSDVFVVNPKSLPALIREKPLASPAGSERRMKQIRFVLESRCRDVPFPGVLSAREAKNAARRALMKKVPKPLTAAGAIS